MNSVQITWTRVNHGIKIEYVGSNGIIITRKGIGSRLYHGRNRQTSKGGYYQINGKGWFATLTAAKNAVAEGRS